MGYVRDLQKTLLEERAALVERSKKDRDDHELKRKSLHDQWVLIDHRLQQDMMIRDNLREQWEAVQADLKSANSERERLAKERETVKSAWDALHKERTDHILEQSKAWPGDERK